MNQPTIINIKAAGRYPRYTSIKSSFHLSGFVSLALLSSSLFLLLLSLARSWLAPHFGQLSARFETNPEHSGHSISAIIYSFVKIIA